MNAPTTRRLKRLCSTFVALVFTFLTANVLADWQYEIEPYANAVTIEGDASVGRATGVGVDVDFDRILESLDMAAMIHFEALNDNGWGIIVDYGFMDLSDDVSGSRGGTLDASLRQGILEVLAFKRQDLSAGSLDYYGGVRWWDNDIEVVIDPAVLPGSLEAEIKEDWVDVVAGLRWRRQINDNWRFQASADIGGFGVESDFTSSVSIGALYSINDRYSLDLRYKATWVDFETGTRGAPGYFEYDTVSHGPLIGFVMTF
jgi:hypothetical protein